MAVDEIYRKRAERKLQPDVVITNLVKASVVITGLPPLLRTRG
jgi:hypothetical protein